MGGGGRRGWNFVERLIIFETGRSLSFSKLNESGNKVDVSLVKSYLNSKEVGGGGELNLFADETS